MADPIDDVEDEVLDADEQDDEGLEPEVADDNPDDQDEDEGDKPDEEDFAVSFDEDEPDDKPESSVIRDLRRRLKEATVAKAAEPEPVIEVGPKPTLEGCDWDEERFETELLAHNTAKAKVEEAKRAKDSQGEAFRAEFNETLANHHRQIGELKVRDFEDTKDAVETALSLAQQTALISAADNSAKLVYALGKHPTKLAALAAITNPFKFAAAVAKLEATLKVTTKTKKAAAPDEPVRGSAPIAKYTDKHLEKMEREADRDPSYDRGKIVRYKREQAAKTKPRR